MPPAPRSGVELLCKQLRTDQTFFQKHLNHSITHLPCVIKIPVSPGSHWCLLLTDLLILSSLGDGKVLSNLKFDVCFSEN